MGEHVEISAKVPRDDPPARARRLLSSNDIFPVEATSKYLEIRG